MNDSLFKKKKKKTNVKKDDILKLAKKIQGKDLNDEKMLRSLIKDVAKLAGKDVSKEKHREESSWDSGMYGCNLCQIIRRQ